MHDYVATCFVDHRPRVYRWAYAMCRRHAEALDVVQEVFLRMLRNPPQPSGAAATIGWLRRATASVVIDRWRSRRTRAAPDQPPFAAQPPSAALETSELADRVRAAMGMLSEQQCIVLLARTYDQLSFREIADELGIAAPTAKTHYVRALRAVRSRLGIDVSAGSPS